MQKTVFSVLRGRRVALLWGTFFLGLLLQAFSSHLKIKNNQFYLPPSFTSGVAEILPAQIVERERRLQFISGILTLGSALGLTACYRRALFGERSARCDPADGSHFSSNSPSSRKAM